MFWLARGADGPRKNSRVYAICIGDYGSMLYPDMLYMVKPLYYDYGGRGLCGTNGRYLGRLLLHCN